jgi:(2Fe-2S) ferredoxin
MKDINSPKNLYFDVHVFCCINERAAGHPRGSCSLRGSIALQEYMKARAKDLKSNIRLRINKSGCLDRCELGPVMVIYPEGIWYHYDDENDIDEILESHIAKGVLVDRLLIDSKQRTLPPKKSERLRLKVSAVKEFAHDICRYELTSADGADLPVFEPGAHIDLFTGQGLRRSYSLAGDCRDRKKYVLGVRREKPSRGGSDWLIDQLSVGDSVEASSPANNFPVDWSASHHLLIAGVSVSRR